MTRIVRDISRHKKSNTYSGAPPVHVTAPHVVLPALNKPLSPNGQQKINPVSGYSA